MSNVDTNHNRKSRAGIALGNRFAGLPRLAECEGLRREDVMTLKEIALVTGYSTITVGKYLAAAEPAVEAMCLVPVSDTGVGRPAPAYSREGVESVFNMGEADDIAESDDGDSDGESAEAAA